MTVEEKRELLRSLHAKMLIFGHDHGDFHPLVVIEIIDTDPDPMRGPYVQASLSFKFPLETTK
jgi:hypothetical protein